MCKNRYQIVGDNFWWEAPFLNFLHFYHFLTFLRSFYDFFHIFCIFGIKIHHFWQKRPEIPFFENMKIFYFLYMFHSTDIFKNSYFLSVYRNFIIFNQFDPISSFLSYFSSFLTKKARNPFFWKYENILLFIHVP